MKNNEAVSEVIISAIEDSKKGRPIIMFPYLTDKDSNLEQFRKIRAFYVTICEYYEKKGWRIIRMKITLEDKDSVVTICSKKDDDLTLDEVLECGR